MPYLVPRRVQVEPIIQVLGQIMFFHARTLPQRCPDVYESDALRMSNILDRLGIHSRRLEISIQRDGRIARLQISQALMRIYRRRRNQDDTSGG